MNEAEQFLAAHPKILVGRDALNKAEAALETNDTFGVVNKPFTNMVLFQEFDGETKKRIFAVALIDDEEAEKYYRDNNQDGLDDEEKEPQGCAFCDGGPRRGPDHKISETAIEQRLSDGRLVYSGENCHWKTREYRGTPPS